MSLSQQTARSRARESVRAARGYPGRQRGLAGPGV